MSMSFNPPAASAAQIWDDSRLGETHLDEKDENKRQSLYVEIFLSVQNIVLDGEEYLFSSDELACLNRLKTTLSYDACYLLIRLSLCKRHKWHTLTSIEQRYKTELGGKEKISKAIDELCGITREFPLMIIKTEEHEIIDLTLDDDTLSSPNNTNANHKQDDVATSASKPQLDNAFVFAEDDTAASLPELLGCLTVDELKMLGKQLKVTKTGQNRADIIDAIMSNASKQSTLTFPVLIPSNNAQVKGKSTMRQPSLNSPAHKTKTQATVIRRLVTGVIGRCIRIHPSIFVLFDRINTIFFRSTSHNASLLLPALMAAFRKRQHAVKEYKRTKHIFSSRQAFLDYEEALALEARVDEVFSGEPSRKDTRRKGREKKGDVLQSSSRTDGAKKVRKIWEEIYDRWKTLLACKSEDTGVSGLERFHHGHVLTRVVYKGVEALAILREHELEVKVLESLLAQTRWRNGCRGAWYDRLALVLMTHSKKTEEMLYRAMNVVIDGLNDEMTHMIYRPRLQRRLTRLERLLKLPMSDRHRCEGRLKVAEDVFVEGVRVKHRAKSVLWDKAGRLISFPPGQSRFEMPFNKTRTSMPPASQEENHQFSFTKGKTIWLGANGEEVSVEECALQYYQTLGFKGFHSEGRVIATIFGLLFWDVIFASVPGAFETPYQSAPLDIFEDCFAPARRELIDKQLIALENNEGSNILQEVYDREGPSRTLCIGVDWSFERQDLIEIVTCLSGHALAVICQTLCEDYGQWRGGVPDLLIWNDKSGECRFVEVKSTNDRLQENQKVWIDVLIGADVSVDLCHVTEKGDRSKKRKVSSARRADTKSREMMSSDVESEDTSLETEEEHMNDRGLVQRVKKRTRDSDDFILSSSPSKKCTRESAVLDSSGS